MKTLHQQATSAVIKFLIALFVVLFLPALTLNFWQAWLYWIVFSVAVIAITFYFLDRDPELIKRRMKAGPGGEKEKTQKIIQSITSILFLLLLVLPGLDHQFHWSYIPATMVILADVLVLLGFWIIFLVFKANSFTSGIIEVSKEQKLITTGPYGLVRHPMYAGALLLFIFTPLALGSWWDIIIGLLLCLMLVIRLFDEEKFLLKNLSGYKDYCRKTRYHLLPFLW